MREYLMPERLIFGQIDFTLLTHEPAQAAKIGGLRLIRMSQIVIEPIGRILLRALLWLRQRSLWIRSNATNAAVCKAPSTVFQKSGAVFNKP